MEFLDTIAYLFWALIIGILLAIWLNSNFIPV